MKKNIVIIFSIMTLCSCADKSLIINNDTDKKIVLFYSEIDISLSNKWIFDYSKSNYKSNGIEYKNNWQILEPTKYLDLKLPYDIDLNDKNDSSYKCKVFILNQDSLAKISKLDKPDSSMINMVLMGSFTINKSFYRQFRFTGISCKYFMDNTNRLKNIK